MMSAEIGLIPGWKILLQSNGYEAQVVLVGPMGAGAAFPCEAASVRADVIEMLMRACMDGVPK